MTLKQLDRHLNDPLKLIATEKADEWFTDHVKPNIAPDEPIDLDALYLAVIASFIAGMNAGAEMAKK